MANTLHRRLVLSVLIVMLTSCLDDGDSSTSSPPESSGAVGKDVEFALPPVPPNVFANLPKDPTTGNPELISVQGVSLQYDVTQKDKITAIAACSGWISACFKPGVREIDDCARSAPVCKTATPWLEDAACCPAACFERYSVARLAGRPSALAVVENYIDNSTCFPSDGKP